MAFLKFIWPAVAIVAGGYLVLLSALFLLQRNMLYLPSSTRPNLQAAGVPEMRALTTRTADGLELSHWFLPPKRADGVVMVVFHGNAGHLGDRLFKFRRLIAAGHGLLLAGYRGYSGNPGSPSEAGLIADGRSVLELLLSQEIPVGRLVLYGESLGSGVAVRLSAEQAVGAVILEAPYTSIAAVAQHHYWYVPVRWLLHDKWDSLARIADVEAPLMVVHGGRDRTIPIAFGRQLFEKAGEPKEAHWIEAAAHNDLYDHGVEAIVMEFVEKHVVAHVRP